MMSSNKKKIIEKYVLDESDNLKHQHSSLAVNLSCSLNLTDSEIDLLKNGQTSVNTRYITGHDIPLKHANIVLEKIKNDAEILDKNCEKLKQVILIKTKQIFDPQNKLTVKTQAILNDKRDQSDTFQNNDCKNFNCLYINSTPKDRQKSQSSTEQRKHSKLNKRRLFDLKEDTNKSGSTRCNSPVLRRLRQIQMDKKMYSDSSKLARKNKKFGNSNIISNIPSALILADESRDNKINCSVESNDKCLLSLNISENDSMFMAMPIGCSTMINNETLGNNHETQHDITYPSLFHSDIKKNVISKEITSYIQRKSLLLDEDSFEDNINDLSGNQLLVENVLESNRAHVLESLCNNFKNTQTFEEHSTKTTKTSLNVNTSINGLSKDNENTDIRKQKDHTGESMNKNIENIENKKNKKVCSTVLEKARESENTISTSLQMNTSLNTSNKLHSQVSNINSATLKLNSTIGREGVLSKIAERNIDNANPITIENSELIKNQKSKSNEVYENQANLISCKTNVITNKIQDGQSYIEATPYPAYRSVLLKTQLKQNAIVSNNINGNSMDTNSFKSKSSCLEQSTSKKCEKLSHEQEKGKSKSITLDNFSLQNLSNVKIPIKGKCKKKLFSLHDSSQLFSFSPMEDENILSERSTLRTKYKKGKKQHVKNKLNIVDNGNSIKHIDAKNHGQLALKNDHTIVCNTKKQKKVKKVISKKFVIKKCANENILGGLEENRENSIEMLTHTYSRSSLNEFQMYRNIPTTQPSIKKTQRVNIVVTGLCNNDKDIVKSVVTTLGRARIESNVTKRTTHVVTTGVRTINLLHGIIRGCWLVTFEWVLRSLENNSWVHPEEYEITHFSKAVLENRKDRQLFGASYVPELFATCGSIHIGKGTTPPYNVLKDLVKTAGGRITECPEVAKIIIDSKGLKESWVLDCITTGELQPFHLYQRP